MTSDQCIVFKFEFSFSEDSNVKEFTCVPCSFENEQVKATCFCQTCEDPEPLCETCATQHTRQKLTRGHEIVKDIWKYFKLQTFLGYFAFSFILPCNIYRVGKYITFFYSYLLL